MSDDIDVTYKAKTKGGGEDLSQEIARTIARQPREQVTCRRITEDHYRCNWWSLQDTSTYDNPGMTGLMVTTSRICQSQFLHVTRTGDGLQIRVISGGRTPAGNHSP
jgi:hypothetical protein